MSAKSAIQLYVESIQKEPLLTAEEERELARRIIRHNDPEARKQLIRSNLRLVVSVAKRFANRGMSLLDLISEGNIGLMQAVDAFNPAMNIRFSTYGSWWIKQSIRRAFSDGGGFVRVPSYMYEKISAWQDAYAELAHSLGREPRIDEFASHIKSTPEHAWAIHWAMHRSWCGGKEPLAIQEVAPDHNTPTADEIAARRDDLSRMRSLLQNLDHRAAIIINLRYGLSGEEPMTLNDVGQRIGVTRERVRQIEMEALHELQESLNPDAPQRRRPKHLQLPRQTQNTGGRCLAAS